MCRRISFVGLSLLLCLLSGFQVGATVRRVRHAGLEVALCARPSRLSHGGIGGNRTHNPLLARQVLYLFGATTPWWRGRDLNSQSPGYEPGGIPNFPTARRAGHDGTGWGACQVG
jgi:hypothetical protein